MSQILGADEDGPNGIYISRINGAMRNDDYTIGQLHALIKEYDDIFSYVVCYP